MRHAARLAYALAPLTASSAAQPDAFFDCASCQCGFGGVDAGLPACEPVHTTCCVAVASTHERGGVGRHRDDSLPSGL